MRVTTSLRLSCATKTGTQDHDLFQSLSPVSLEAQDCVDQALFPDANLLEQVLSQAALEREWRSFPCIPAVEVNIHGFNF